jgi:hypothetical protein
MKLSPDSKKENSVMIEPPPPTKKKTTTEIVICYCNSKFGTTYYGVLSVSDRICSCCTHQSLCAGMLIVTLVIGYFRVEGKY